jgi:hypothetical protein
MGLLATLVHGSGAAPVNTGAPWQTLQAAVSPSAIYDNAVGVTVVSSAVTAWADATGTCPSLTAQGSGTAIAVVGGLITITAGGKLLESATASSLFDTSHALTIAVIMNAPSGGAQKNAFALSEAGGSSGYTRMLGMQSTSGAGDYQGVGATSIASRTSSAVALDSNLRLIIVSQNSSNLNLDVPNQTRDITGSSVPAAGNNYLTIGGYYIEAAELTMGVAAIVVIPGAIAATGTAINALKTYAATKSYTPA